MSYVKSKMPGEKTRSKAQEVFIKHARRLHHCIHSLQGSQ